MDDFSLSYTAKSAKENCKALAPVVNSLIDDAAKQGVFFDPGKTELIHFTNKGNSDTPMTIGGKVIQPKPLVRWLGVYFDNRLAFKSHIEKRLNLATSAFFGLQRLTNTQKGLNSQATRKLYTSCITSIAEYGAPIWWSKKTPKSTLGLFQRLQNQAIRLILGAFKGSPSKALELEAGIPPPEIRLEKHCNRYALRALSFNPIHPIRKIYTEEAADELGPPDDSVDIRYIRPYTQLLSLITRIKAISPPNIQFEQSYQMKPWDTFPASFIISKEEKEKETANCKMVEGDEHKLQRKFKGEERR